MVAWLFTWNPKHYPWNEPLDGYRNMKSEIEQIGFSFQRWTCGHTKKIKSGDRIFLMRLGQSDAGIVASGTAASDVFIGPHWDPDSAKNGRSVDRVFVKFDHIMNPDSTPILTRQFLMERFPDICWSPQASGISIPTDIAFELEKLWQSILK